MAIQVEDLCYTYGEGTALERQALKHVSFEIQDGEFVGPIGHTGSGKSTPIQHLNGLIKPTSGDIKYQGVSIYSQGYKLKDLRSKVGLVFQYPEYQLFEADILQTSVSDRKSGASAGRGGKTSRHALKLVGMDEKFYKQSPFELSGGQKRRVAIAGVLAMRPEMMILDEPTAGLDPQGAMRFWSDRAPEPGARADDFGGFPQHGGHGALRGPHHGHERRREDV